MERYEPTEESCSKLDETPESLAHLSDILALILLDIYLPEGILEPNFGNIFRIS